MAGNKQPIDLLIVKGKKNLTKKEIEQRKESEVKAPSENIIAPEYLTDELKIKFYDIAKQLLNIGIMSDLDCESLARYLTVEDQYQKVTKKILTTKDVTSDKYSNLLQLQDKIFKMCRSSACDLGLTISSRCKLVVPKKQEEEPQSKWSSFGAGKSG